MPGLFSQYLSLVLEKPPGGMVFLDLSKIMLVQGVSSGRFAARNEKILLNALSKLHRFHHLGRDAFG
jgi:hypothetical protein